MEQENTLLRTKKIRLKLTSLQIKMLNQWKDDCRYSYNKAIGLIQENHYSDFELRNIITPVETCSRIPWILETPKALREGAVFEANKNKKAAITNLKNKNITHFNLRFASSKKVNWTLYGFDNVIKTSQKSISIYPRYNFGRLHTTEIIPDGKLRSCNIHFDGIYYYICIPVETEYKKFIDKNKNKNPLCSIDPGQRTFHTVYDPLNECCYKIGEGASNKIYLNLLTLDNLISQKSKLRNKKAKMICDDKISKLRRRIKNLQKELHDKTSNWLTSNFKSITIPRFESKNMIKKSKRKISTKTVRNMMTLCHGLFLEKLKAKAIQNSSTVVIVNEMYTTMMCGKCFYKNNSIGSLSCWKCPRCDWYHINAARNILFKEFGEFW